MSLDVAASGPRGGLLDPLRLLPAVDWPVEHFAMAFGPRDVNPGVSAPDLSWGIHEFAWVAYVVGGQSFLRRKNYGGVWDDNPRELLTLTEALNKIELEFDSDGEVILGYLRQDATMGVWWRDPDSGLPALLEIDSDVQDVLIGLEERNRASSSDVLLWYFKNGRLYLRRHSERFQIQHEPDPTISGLVAPVIIQAGVNHRYGYQVDYRDDADEN